MIDYITTNWREISIVLLWIGFVWRGIQIRGLTDLNIERWEKQYAFNQDVLNMADINVEMHQKQILEGLPEAIKRERGKKENDDE